VEDEAAVTGDVGRDGTAVGMRVGVGQRRVVRVGVSVRMKVSVSMRVAMSEGMLLHDRWVGLRMVYSCVLRRGRKERLRRRVVRLGMEVGVAVVVCGWVHSSGHWQGGWRLLSTGWAVGGRQGIGQRGGIRGQLMRRVVASHGR